MRDPAFRSLAKRSASSGWDVACALFNLALAFVYQSFWFASMAAYFAFNSRSIADGLVDQLDDFAQNYEGTGLVIVDTLQKVRAPSRDSAYAADYGDVGALKGFADSHGLVVFAVHHTRKMGDADVFNTVSGATGITGSADSTFVLAKQSRSSDYATLSLIGRDVESQELKLRFNDCSWG